MELYSMDVNTDILVQGINFKFFPPAAGVLAILHVAIALQILHRLLQRLFVRLRKNLCIAQSEVFLRNANYRVCSETISDAIRC